MAPADGSNSYDDLVEAIYEAALHPELWRQVVDISVRAFGGVGASVYTPFSDKLGLEPVWSTDADAEFIAAYASKYAHSDVLYPALISRIPAPSLIYAWDDLVDRKVFEAWPGYAELIEPRGVQTGVGLMVNTDDYLAAQLMVYSNSRADSFVQPAKEKMHRLEPHLSRAFRIHWHLVQARRTAESMQVTLDMFRTSVAWLSVDGHLLHANAELERLLEGRDGVALQGGRLAFDDGGANRQLLEAIAAAARGKTSALLAERFSGSPALRVTVVPLPVHASALRLVNAAAIALISEAERPTRSSLDAACALYKLTKAEGRVLEHLVAGKDIGETAGALNVSPATVRTQVKTIFQKCAVSRQADLIRLVATLPQIAAPQRPRQL